MGKAEIHHARGGGGESDTRSVRAHDDQHAIEASELGLIPRTSTAKVQPHPPDGLCYASHAAGAENPGAGGVATFFDRSIGVLAWGWELSSCALAHGAWDK